MMIEVVKLLNGRCDNQSESALKRKEDYTVLVQARKIFRSRDASTAQT